MLSGRTGVVVALTPSDAKIQGRTCREVNIENLGQVRVERSGEKARGGGLAGAHLTGEQTRARMPREQFEPRPDLLPGFGGEQLLAVRRVAKRSFLKPKNDSHI